MIPFNVKTHYSLQQAFAQIKPLVKRAKELELKALCITDYNTLSGCVEFFQECKKNEIKPILGVTVMTKFGELILLSANKDGWVDLIKLVNRIDAEGITSWENLEQYSENLIAVCNNKLHFDFFANDLRKFKFKRVVAYEMVYENYPYIEGNQILYINEDEKLYQEIVTCSRLKITLDELDHDKYNFDTNYLYYDEKFDSSDILYDLCEDYEISHNPQYPDFDVENPDEYITNLCRDGWKNKLTDKVKNNPTLKQVYTDRIKYELEVFKEANLSNYMLIMRDIIMFARKNNISVGLRGSASGCLISYLIDISNIDPIIPDPTLPYDPHKSLSFDRFFNKARKNSTPDIDLDIALSFREKIITYVEEKYGLDHCGHIITFNTLDGRGALKEVFRIFGYDAELANSITRKMLDTAKIQDVLEDLKEENPNYTVIHYCIDNIPEIKNAYQDYQKEFNVAIHLSGLIRSLGKHAAGIVISPTRLEDTIPVVTDSKSGKLVVAWEMADCEYAGAVKYDFLGVAAYEKIDKIIDMVNNNKREVIINA